MVSASSLPDTILHLRKPFHHWQTGATGCLTSSSTYHQKQTLTTEILGLYSQLRNGVFQSHLSREQALTITWIVQMMPEKRDTAYGSGISILWTFSFFRYLSLKYDSEEFFLNFLLPFLGFTSHFWWLNCAALNLRGKVRPSLLLSILLDAFGVCPRKTTSDTGHTYLIYI